MSRDFKLQILFMNHLPPKPLKITVGSFQIFSNIRGDIRKSRCTTGINVAPVARCKQSDIVPIICHKCRSHRWCTLSCEYSCEFSKKFEIAFVGYSGAWGKLIHEKSWSLKSRGIAPLIIKRNRKATSSKDHWNHRQCRVIAFKIWVNGYTVIWANTTVSNNI